MDNSKLMDFLVVGRLVLCVSICALSMPAWSVAAEKSDIPVQQTEEGQRAASPAIQKIQRLLKRLADQYPQRYRSVDPGSVDGVYGESTKIAIRNFRAIAGLVKDPRPDDQLARAILAEIAEMTAADPEAPQTKSPFGCAQAPAGTGCPEALAAGARNPDASTAGKTLEPAMPISKGQKAVPATATGALAQSDAADGKPDAVPASSASPSQEAVVRYFVQVASLRNLEAAQREWSRIKLENRNTLQDAKNRIESVDISGRGVFHRVLIGPLPNRDDARLLCGTLRQNGQTCMVVRRSNADSPVADERQAETGKASAGRIGPSQQTYASPPALSPQSPDAGQISERAEVAPSTTVQAMPPTASAADQAAAAAGTSPEPPVRTTQAPALSTPANPPIAVSNAPTPQDQARAQDASASGDGHLARDQSPATVMPKVGGMAPAKAQTEDLGDYVAATDRDRTKAQAEPKAHTGSAAPAPPRSLGERAIGFGQKVWRKLRDLIAPAALAVVVIGTFLLYKVKRRKRREAIAALIFPNEETVNRFPLPGMEEQGIGEIRSLSVLEDAFDSERLQASRQVRDAFLREVLFDDTETLANNQSRESAIHVNSRLKRLLVTDPERYKSIFLNLIFLSKVGAALNRKDIVREQLNGRFSRELDLLQSYFRIHLLELDDRHQIRKELPGLFYCLQVNQLQKGPANVHFSAA